MRIFLTFFIIFLSLYNKTAAQQENFAAERTAWQLDADENIFHFNSLQAYDSYFRQATSFGLSFLRYKPRGYDWRYRDFRMGGVAITDWFRGMPAWNAVSGLTSVGSAVYDRDQTVPAAIGQNEDRQILPWQQQKGGKVTLSTSNRTYNLRGTAGYNSGENAKNGWSYSLFAGRSWGESYVIDGVWNDSWAAFGSVSKRFGGGRHRIALTAWYAPTERALQSASTAEAYKLTGNNLYNPAWGRWGDKKRSANVREARQPVAMVTHEYASANEKLKITTALAACFGTESHSGLDWQNAPNPRPDYYRNMPSFQPEGSEMRKIVTELWRTDENVRQIDWAALVSRNRNDSPRAHYILASRVRDYRELTLQSGAEWRPNDQTLFRGGIGLFAAENLNYKRLDDLLGADYWLDVDVFAENPEDVQNQTQSDMRHPNRQVREGEQFGYKYSMQALMPRLWVRFTKRRHQWDFEAAGTLGMAAYHRFGYYDKQNFPGAQSFGWSPWLARAEWLVQGGLGYHIGSRFRAGFRFTAQRLAPTPQNAFIAPEYRNALVPDLKNEDILGAEVSVDYRTPFFRAYFGAFATSFRNRTEVRDFYDDLNHFFCNYLMSGIDTRHAGIELSAEVQLGQRLWLRAAGVVSDNRYTSDPTALELQESTGEQAGTETVYYESLHTAGGPQTVGVLEIEYTPRSWIFSAAVNGFAGNYIAPTPLRRTARAWEKIDYRIAFDQENLGAGATVDLFAGRTFYLREQRLGIYAGVNNVLNRRNIRTGGYEALRLRKNATGNYLPLDSKYYYAQGINFFVTAACRF